MTLRAQALLAALAATASWSIAPAALAQDPEEQAPPSPSAAQDPTAEEPMPGQSATEEQSQEMPPTRQSNQQSNQSAAPPSPSAGAPIEDEKIDRFADAYLAVHTIQQKASQDLQAAGTPEEANKVKASAESQMIAAVERSGLQVPEFNRIVETMAADPSVRSRVAAKLQERSGGAIPEQQ